MKVEANLGLAKLEASHNRDTAGSSSHIQKHKYAHTDHPIT